MTYFARIAFGGLAGALASGSMALAADLGRPAPAAVDYVRVCDSYGAGFFYIPGSETCIRIGGGVRFDAAWTEADFIVPLDRRSRILRSPTNPKGFLYAQGLRFRSWNEITTLARARVDVETRSMTDFGMLRSVARVEFEFGNFNEPFNPVSLSGRNLTFNQTILREAYVQWGGLTAGMTYSLFNLPYFLTYSNPFTSDLRANMLAYQFGSGGFTAAIALEDPTLGRRGFIGPYGGANVTGSNYGGLKYPDVIGMAKYVDPRFSVQVSAAAHHINRPSFQFPAWNVPATDDWGFAAQIGGEFKFNQKGSVYGGVAYTEGASNFSGVGADDDRLGNGAGFSATDGYTRKRNGDFVPTRILSSHVGMGYNLTDRVRTAASFGYARVEDDFRAVIAGRGPRADYDAYKALGLIEWSPAQNFRIGAELGYTAIEFDAASKRPASPNFPRAYRLVDSDRFSVLLRVDRKF